MYDYHSQIFILYEAVDMALHSLLLIPDIRIQHPLDIGYSRVAIRFGFSPVYPKVFSISGVMGCLVLVLVYSVYREHLTVHRVKKAF